jgi:hypothetical protein
VSDQLPPRDAVTRLRGLGVTRVRLTQHNARAWVVKDPPTIARVLAAIEPGSRSTIAFEAITRDATLPALADLVAAEAEYLHITGTTSALRAWPRRDLYLVGLGMGELRVGHDVAFARFREACADAWIEGYVTEPGREAVAALARALAETDQP